MKSISFQQMLSELVPPTEFILELYVTGELYNTYTYESPDKMGKRARKHAQRKGLRVTSISKFFGDLEHGKIVFRAHLEEHTEESLRAKELRLEPKKNLVKKTQELTGLQLKDYRKDELIRIIIETEDLLDDLNEYFKTED